MKGRKPKPTHLRLVGGNAGRRPINRKEPRPTASMPTAPDVLKGAARNEWRRVAAELHKLGILTGVDRAALAAYCQAYGRWVVAERSIANRAAEDATSDGGLVITTTNGNVVQNPLVGVANKAMADMVRYAAEFGMTPSARSRIQAEGKAAKEDPAAEFLG